MSADVFDETLERFDSKGPEFGPGLSNHGPMAADALVAMGRGDAVASWAEWYVTRLAEPPMARNAIAEDEWREALGDIKRAGDWSTFFARQLDRAAWRDVLEIWVARLMPGIMAGATHGILRTAHAVRSLDRGETPQRVRELGEGLAYWAARYQELPSAAPAQGTLHVGDAIARVPLVDASYSRRGLIFDVVKGVDDATFGPAINLVASDGDVGAFVSDVTGTFVRQYLRNAATASIAFVHTVTAPSSLRILAPHLSPATTREAMRYAWQACASIYSAYGTADAVPSPAYPSIDGFDAADLIDEAVGARDEHAIKFTEACLREHALSGDAAFVIAARDAVSRLRVRS